MVQRVDYEEIAPQIAMFDSVIRDGDRLKLLSIDQLKALPPAIPRYWCLTNGIYVLPTIELVDYLRNYVDSSTIEIGSGQNFLFHHLGIQGTDSAVQQTPAMQFYYMMLGQKATNPPEGVDRVDAATAIAKYRPKAVIATWVTQLADPDDEQGNLFGVDEEAIVDSGIKYVFVGCRAEHGRKKILNRPHIEIPGAQCGVFSRATHKDDDYIWLWNC